MKLALRLCTHLTQVVICGPRECGKTRLTRILCEHRDTIGYEPTEGVRIQSIDRVINGSNVTIQLWDSSGDQQFQNMHTAIAANMQALILCYNPEQQSHLAELEKWMAALVGDRQVSVLILALKQAGSGSKSELHGSLKRIMNGTITFPSDASAVQNTADAADAELERLLSTVLRKKTEADEARLVNMGDT